jgi:hypothetical protein
MHTRPHIGSIEIIVVIAAVGVLLMAGPAPAQEHHAHGGGGVHGGHSHGGHSGHHGVGHDTWHEGFYSKLKRKDNKTSCCNLNDCVPTQSRMMNDRYEVLVEGEWTPVPQDVIQNVTAPDGGAHVCFPKASTIYPKGTLFCVVLPPET